MKNVNLYLYNNREYTLRQLSGMTGIKADTLYDRCRRGASMEEAVAMGAPASNTSRLYNYRGQMLTMAEIAKIAGISVQAARERLHKGWTIEQIAELPKGALARPHSRAVDNTDIYSLTEGMTPEESTRWHAAHKICRLIMTDNSLQSNFRCIAPMTEYAFDGDILTWRIRFAPDGRTAVLTAHYRYHGFDSDFKRTFQIVRNDIKEVCPE